MPLCLSRSTCTFEVLLELVVRNLLVSVKFADKLLPWVKGLFFLISNGLFLFDLRGFIIGFGCLLGRRIFYFFGLCLPVVKSWLILCFLPVIKGDFFLLSHLVDYKSI